MTNQGEITALDAKKWFGNDQKIEMMSVNDLAKWFKSDKPGKLRLPAIQRSFVWRNEQIVNYWDSLMRGYPPGVILVTRVSREGTAHFGRGDNNTTEQLTEDDFELIDGQQRLLSLLLGLGQGSLKESRRLWIDIGKPKPPADRLYEFRVNSTGQPFGYKADQPNEKIRVEDRRKAEDDWPKDDGKPRAPEVIFLEIGTHPVATLSASKCTVSLSHIIDNLSNIEIEATAKDLCDRASRHGVQIEDGDVRKLLERIRRAMKAEMIVHLVDADVLREDRGYARFFARVGQGGTRLSDDELTYSLIKDAYPLIHDRMVEIVKDKDAGRLSSEVDFVLGAVRVAQTLAPWPEMEEGERAGRPTPDSFHKLRDKGRGTTIPKFLEMVPEEKSTTFPLKTAVVQLRKALEYADSNPSGIPTILLARLPRELLDVLILFAFKRGEALRWENEDRDTLIAFCLHWLLFVADDGKAAKQTFLTASGACWRFNELSASKLIRGFEEAGVARYAPRKTDDWEVLKKEIEERSYPLATWSDRFSSIKCDEKRNPGAALRVLSTNRELIKRALMWAQRRYIGTIFPYYDPTSTHDDDLPFDLDHVIPAGLFGEHWTSAEKRCETLGSGRKQFKDGRHIVGNSLGNFRWLSASDNRGRGLDTIEAELPQANGCIPLDDEIQRDNWNSFIERFIFKQENHKSKMKELATWTKDEVAMLQQLIDSRTILIVKKIIDESQLINILAVADQEAVTPMEP